MAGGVHGYRVLEAAAALGDASGLAETQLDAKPPARAANAAALVAPSAERTTASSKLNMPSPCSEVVAGAVTAHVPAHRAPLTSRSRRLSNGLDRGERSCASS